MALACLQPARRGVSLEPMNTQPPSAEAPEPSTFWGAVGKGVLIAGIGIAGQLAGKPDRSEPETLQGALYAFLLACVCMPLIVGAWRFLTRRKARNHAQE